MNEEHVMALEDAHARATKRAADPAVADEHKRIWSTVADIALIVLQILKAQPR